jgi:hypothetical protein
MAEAVFHRVETDIQTSALAKMQVESGEVWGREPRGSHFLVVQAYRNELPAGKRGIQFTTKVSPHRGSGTSFEARWYYPLTEGVEKRTKNGQDYAAIKAVVENKQL